MPLSIAKTAFLVQQCFLHVQVSGISFSFNPSQPPGQRIVHNSVKVNGQVVDWKYVSAFIYVLFNALIPLSVFHLDFIVLDLYMEYILFRS